MRRDLRVLAGIVSEHRADLPACGLPQSLLGDLNDLFRCDDIAFEGFDSRRQRTLFAQSVSGGATQAYTAVH